MLQVTTLGKSILTQLPEIAQNPNDILEIMAVAWQKLRFRSVSNFEFRGLLTGHGWQDSLPNASHYYMMLGRFASSQRVFNCPGSPNLCEQAEFVANVQSFIENLKTTPLHKDKAEQIRTYVEKSIHFEFSSPRQSRA